jgi:hypothetical protein
LTQAAASAGDSTSVATAAFDPGAHTIADVLAYVDEHPEQVQSVYDAESDGKARTTLLADLEGRGAS